jgi:type IV secretory pathway VirB4 component
MNNPVEMIKDYRKKRAEQPKVHRLSFGAQDPMDIISYASLEEAKDYLHIGNRYVRTIFISGYPYEAEQGWLDSLINFHHNADISFHIEHADSNDALQRLKRKITELESTRQAKLRGGGIVDPDIEDPLASAKELFAAIKRGQEKLFQVSIYVALTSDTLEGLEDMTKMLTASLSARLFYTTVANYRQTDGLQSILPRGENVLAQKRDLNSSTAALSFPFTSTEFVQETGILYGVNNKNKSLVILDRYKLQNANSIVFAQSGAGKSYATKVEILRQLTQGTKVIVIDPEREYENITNSVGGTYIKLSAKSEQKINPFDLATTSRDGETMAEHIQDLTEIVSLMVGGLNEEEKAAVDKAIIAVYAKAKNNAPLLADFYNKLYELGQHKLCMRLERYTKGSLTDILDSHTNIDLTNRLVVFDIKDLPESLRQIMMMIIANFVQNTVKAKPEKRLLVIDEGWLLLEHDESARFVAGLVRRARKYYLAVSIISQQANDFLGSKYGSAIASQSALRILMKQDTTTIEKVASEFNLSDEEKQYLLTCDRGDALIIADQNHVAVHVAAADDEHPLITTDPTEIKKTEKPKKKASTKSKTGKP